MSMKLEILEHLPKTIMSIMTRVQQMFLNYLLIIGIFQLIAAAIDLKIR